jgi:Domain of unknown function (DUF4129)
MTGRRAGVSAVALTVLSVGLMLVLVMLAARVGPQRIIHGPLIDPKIAPVSFSYSQPPGAPVHTPQGEGLMHTSGTLQAIGWVIKVLFGLCVLWLFYRGYRRLGQVWADRKRRDPRPQAVEFDVLDDPEQLAEEIRDDFDAQLALLLDGQARNAIVACWDRFEEQAERAGLARHEWETSSEFTIRVLDLVSADEGAVSQLERLYREARFSEHPIDESHREAAIGALERIHLSLRPKVAR